MSHNKVDLASYLEIIVILKFKKKIISANLRYGSIPHTHFTWQELPKGEALPVYVWDFRKWKIFPNCKIKYLYHKAI